MIDSIRFTWKIDKIEVVPNFNNLSNVVKRVVYEVKGECIDRGPHSSLMGETTLLDPDPGSFIPYFELTEETVVKWVKLSIGTQTINDHEQEIRAQVEKIIKPSLVEMDKPWELKELDKVVTFKDQKKKNKFTK